MAARIVLLIFLVSSVQGRFLKLNSSDNNLISDGTDLVENQARTCDHQYGFLPCAENAPGYLFQMLVYQGLLMFGENQIVCGSEVLFSLFGVGKFGGIVFRILVSLPSMMLMVVSGVFSSKENAKSLVSLGVGIFAGVSVFSLTLQWGLCVIFAGIKSGDGGKFAVLKDGAVKIDDPTRDTAGIMLLSLVPYVVVQLVNVINTSAGTHIMTLFALIVSSLSLLLYFGYQMWHPWMQERSLRYANYQIDRIMSKIMKHAQTQLLECLPLVTKEGEPNLELLQALFDRLDANGDKSLTQCELQQLITTVEELKAKSEEIINELFKDLDTDGNNVLDQPEFIKGMSRWLKKAASVTKADDKTKAVEEFHDLVWKKRFSKRSFALSLFQLLLGIVALTFLGGPLVNSILQLSFALNLPTFSISFIIVPLFMNAKAAIAALLPASQKDETSASLTFSEIYSTVIMNNISGLTVLLAIVYTKGLTWDFSAEVLTILFVGAVIGILAYRSTRYPVWICILAFLLYPFSLAAYYIAHVFLSLN